MAKDSKSSKKKKGEKAINLRPNQTEVLKKNITEMFQTFNDEK